MATATKTSFKTSIRAASNLIALIPSRFIRQMLANFFEVEFCITAQEKKKRIVILCSRPRQHVLSRCSGATTQRRQRNVQKSLMHVQSCYYQSKPNGFLPFSLPLPLPLPLLKLPRRLRDERNNFLTAYDHSSFLNLTIGN